MDENKPTEANMSDQTRYSNIAVTKEAFELLKQIKVITHIPQIRIVEIALKEYLEKLNK
jgi:hypothetical protein